MLLARSELRGVLLLSLGAIGAAAVLEASGSHAYAIVLGDIHPVATTVVACLLGVAALRILAGYDWFRPAGGSRGGYLLALALGVVWPIPVLIVDAMGGFAEGINVVGPDALLFYPAIALVAELVLHAAPLALVAVTASAVSRANDRARAVGIVLAALPEPVFQVVWGAAYSPVWANSYVGIHLLVFNLLGLAIFRRHGFLAAYVYRLSYYAVWHIVWGHLRLAILFGQ